MWAMFRPMTGTCFFAARLPATASSGRRMRKRPISMASPMVRLYQGVFALIPAKALPLFPVPLVYAYRISRKSVRTVYW